jgi:hypothetical protein
VQDFIETEKFQKLQLVGQSGTGGEPFDRERRQCIYKKNPAPTALGCLSGIKNDWTGPFRE